MLYICLKDDKEYALVEAREFYTYITDGKKLYEVENLVFSEWFASYKQIKDWYKNLPKH